MRTRLKNSDEVCHVWAQQKQWTGRASNMFFEGPSIFSYGHHFEIARFITPEIVLFTTRSYSNTTSKHISYAHQAVSHKTKFTVPSFTDHNENGRYLVEEVKEEIARYQRARKGFEYGPKHIDGMIIKANSYLKLFTRKMSPDVRKSIRGLEKYRLKNLSPEFVAVKLKRERELAATADARAEVAREIRRKAKAIDDAEKIAKWKNGENVYPSYDWPMMLRVKGDAIETSQHAEIPLSAARRLWRRFLKDRSSVAGLNLGHYTVNALEVTDGATGPDVTGTLIVGCHRIPTAELYRLADILGWRNGVPYDATEVLQ